MWQKILQGFNLLIDNHYVINKEKITVPLQQNSTLGTALLYLYEKPQLSYNKKDMHAWINEKLRNVKQKQTLWEHLYVKILNI
jgi:hypothetical protein